MYRRMPKHPVRVCRSRVREAPWAESEFKTLDLGDARRDKRFKQMAADFSAQPGQSIPQASENWGATKAAYRLFDNEAVEPAAVLAAHREATLARAQGEAVLLVVQDTTTLNFSTHARTKGLGPIGNNRDTTIGFFAHASLCVREDGEALGLLDLQTWARDPEKFHPQAKGARNRRPVEENESIKWLRSLEATVAAAARMPGKRWLNVADREGDCYELFRRHRQLCGDQVAVDLLVRCQHNRTLTHDTVPLFAHVGQQAVATHWEVAVPRQPGQRARVARLAIRFAPVTLAPPAHQVKYQGHTEPIPVWVISALEEAPPAGVAAIHWQLLSTQPVTTAAEAIVQVQRYSQRWEIELWHKILKSGCRTEERQLETRTRLERCLVLDAIVAWRILALSKSARGAQADSPCTAWLAEHEWQALWCHVHDATQPPTKPPSIREAVRWIARLGGFLGRKRDGEPGTMVLWRGLQRLQDFAKLYRLFATQAKTCG